MHVKEHCLYLQGNAGCFTWPILGSGEGGGGGENRVIPHTRESPTVFEDMARATQES